MNRCPADLCYWAVLDAPISGAGELPPGLVLLASEQVPVPIDELFVVGAPAGPSRTIACARRRNDLERVDPKARALAPDRIPPGLGVEIDPAILNFLVGPFEPRSARRARRRIHAGLAAALLASALLVALGLARRERHWARLARDAERSAETMLARAVTTTDPAALDAEIAGLESFVLASRGHAPAADASLALESVLRAWPASTNASPLSIRVLGEVVTIAATLEGDPAEFLAALVIPEGWSLDEPRLHATDRLTRLTLTLRPPARAHGDPR